MPGQLTVIDLGKLDHEIITLWETKEADPLIARIVLSKDKEQHDLLIRYIIEKIGELAHHEKKL